MLIITTKAVYPNLNYHSVRYFRRAVQKFKEHNLLLTLSVFATHFEARISEERKRKIVQRLSSVFGGEWSD